MTRQPLAATGPAAAPWRAVKASIEARIRARDWPPGFAVPSETLLAVEFGCARATVNRAMRELAEEGVLDRRRRTGTRVSAAPVRRARLEVPLIRIEVETTGARYRHAMVAREALPAPGWLAAQFSLAPGTPVLRLEAMHYADDAPWQHEARWINLAAVPEAAAEDFAALSPNEWLVGRVPLSELRSVLSAAPAEAEVARFLGVAPGTALLRAERTTWLDGALVTHARLSHPPGYRIVSEA